MELLAHALNQTSFSRGVHPGLQLYRTALARDCKSGFNDLVRSRCPPWSVCFCDPIYLANPFRLTERGAHWCSDVNERSGSSLTLNPSSKFVCTASSVAAFVTLDYVIRLIWIIRVPVNRRSFSGPCWRILSVLERNDLNKVSSQSPAFILSLQRWCLLIIPVQSSFSESESFVLILLCDRIISVGANTQRLVFIQFYLQACLRSKSSHRI